MISVIIPTYNRRELLLRAVASVLSQTHTDLECIIVDDGSTDGTEEAVRALTDPRVRYIRQENAGACAARNQGIDQARGDCIAFQDSDDAWRPEKLACQLATLRQSGADVTFCAMAREGQRVPEGVGPGEIGFGDMLLGSLASTQCIMGRAAVFRVVRFDPAMPRLQDWDLMLRVAKEYRVVFDDTPLVDVTVRPDSISSQPRKLYDALLRLYGKHHEAINARDETALHWVRSILGAAPKGVDPWSEGLMDIAPEWVVHPGQRDRMARATLHTGRGDRGLFLDIGAFRCGEGRLFLPESLLKEALLLGASFAEATELQALVQWKGRRFAWDVLFDVRGGGAVAAEMAAQCLLDMPAWARALRDLPLPEGTGPLRRIGVYYHSIRGGGVQRAAAAQIRLFAAMGLDVTLITEHAPDPADEPLPEGLARETIPALDPSSPDTNRAHVIALAEASRGLDLVVYHAWASPMVLFDLLAVRSEGVRVLVHTHSVFTLPLLEPGMRDRFDALPDVYGLASGVAALSGADACYWRRANSRVFPVVHPLTFDPAQTPANPLDGKRLMWVGRFSREKRPEDALRILRLVRTRVPEVRLTLLGDGGKADLLRLAQAEGVADCVDFPGFVSDPKPYYARADILLCTSAYEGFGLAMVEAQTCGIPVVTYDMPWLTVLQGGGHIAVPQGDVSAAADAVVALLADGPKRVAMGRAARENVEGWLNVDQRSQWAGIFASMEGEAPERPLPADEDVMLATLRAHATACTPGERASGAVQTAFVPLPERGPLKMVRKKAATFLQVLLIDGIPGVKRVLKKGK